MVKAERVSKLVAENSKILNRLLVAYEDNILNEDNKSYYEELRKALENNEKLEEELAS